MLVQSDELHTDVVLYVRKSMVELWGVTEVLLHDWRVWLKFSIVKENFVFRKSCSRCSGRDWLILGETVKNEVSQVLGMVIDVVYFLRKSLSILCMFGKVWSTFSSL